MAAFLTVRDRFIEGVGPFAIEISFQEVPVGVIGFNFCMVFFVRAAPDGIGLRKKTSRVEGENGDGQAGGKDIVGDHLVFHAETGGENDLAGILACQ